MMRSITPKVHISFCFATCVLFSCLYAISAESPQAKDGSSKVPVTEPLPIESAVFAHSLIGGADLSRDGRWLAYTVDDPKRASELERSPKWYFNAAGTALGLATTDIWIVNVESKQARNLTGGVGSNWAPVWSPDGKRLAFYSDRDGRAGLWVYEAGGRMYRAADVVTRARLDVPIWTTDSTKVLTKVLSEGDPIALPIGAGDEAKPAPSQPSGSSPDVSVYRWFPGERTFAALPESTTEDDFTKVSHADLSLIDVSNRTCERIARGFNVISYDFSADGSRVAFISNTGSVKGNVRSRLYNLYEVTANQKPRLLVADIPSPGTREEANWSPDGKWLSYKTADSRWNVEFYVVSSEGGEPRKAVKGKLDTKFGEMGEILAPLWSNDGESLYSIVHNRDVWKISLRDGSTKMAVHIDGQQVIKILGPKGRCWSPDGEQSMVVLAQDEKTADLNFYKADLRTGQTVRLLGGNKTYSVAAEMHAGADIKKIVLQVEDASRAPDLWVVNSDFQKMERVTRVNEEWDRYEWGSAKIIEWRTADGRSVRGVLLLPSGYDSKKKYPLIVDVYPNWPALRFTNRFGGYSTENLQLFTTRGYAVLTPEVPVTRGGGQVMSEIAKAVIPGVSEVVRTGIADPNRVGVMGASKGGYAVLSLIVQTDWFKAAVMRSGFGDLIGHYGQMDDDGAAFGLGIIEQDDTGGTPWQYRERFLENSPIFYLDRAQTPLLIIHGDSDPAVHSFLADEIFVSLRRIDKKVEYAKYHGEGHRIVNPANRIDWIEREIKWFDSHLKGDLPKQDSIPSASATSLDKK